MVTVVLAVVMVLSSGDDNGGHGGGDGDSDGGHGDGVLVMVMMVGGHVDGGDGKDGHAPVSPPSQSSPSPRRHPSLRLFQLRAPQSLWYRPPNESQRIRLKVRVSVAVVGWLGGWVVGWLHGLCLRASSCVTYSDAPQCWVLVVRLRCVALNV